MGIFKRAAKVETMNYRGTVIVRLAADSWTFDFLGKTYPVGSLEVAYQLIDELRLERTLWLMANHK